MFVMLALVAVICLKGARELMLEKVEATVGQLERGGKISIQE